MSADIAEYNSTFYAYTDRMALRSAARVVPVVQQMLDVETVADFGCGNGGWLAAWHHAGVDDYVGVDGGYVDPDRLLFDRSRFICHDLAQPVDLGRRFDLVQSLEVAEHLPQAAASQFIENLAAHGDVILFSAAAPGQGGYHHINEQPYAYWRDLFADHGYEMFDSIRPVLLGCREVEPWYRFNTFLYVARRRLATLPEWMLAQRVQRGQTIPDVAPLLYRCRKRVLRRLPVAMVNLLSRCHTAWSHAIHRKDAHT